MQGNLAGKRIAILATDGFEQSELTEPRNALAGAGAEVDIVSLRPGRIQGMKHKEKGEEVEVTKLVSEASAGDYQALVLPGGVANPDELRTHPEAVRFVADFFRAGKPVAAVCHGPWMLVEADVVRGRTVTSWPSLQTDLKNAGADWVDREVVLDDNLVTSRKPSDLPAFCEKFIMLVGSGEEESEDESQDYADDHHTALSGDPVSRGENEGMNIGGEAGRMAEIRRAEQKLERMRGQAKPH